WRDRVEHRPSGERGRSVGVELYPAAGGIVGDGRQLAAPAQDVAVDRVPGGVADATGEPAPVDAGIGIEHLLGWLDPVDVPRRFAPKALRIALPARIDVVIAARAGIHGAAPSGLTTSSRGTAVRRAG